MENDGSSVIGSTVESATTKVSGREKVVVPQGCIEEAKGDEAGAVGARSINGCHVDGSTNFGGAED